LFNGFNKQKRQGIQIPPATRLTRRGVHEVKASEVKARRHQAGIWCKVKFGIPSRVGCLSWGGYVHSPRLNIKRRIITLKRDNSNIGIRVA